MVLSLGFKDHQFERNTIQKYLLKKKCKKNHDLLWHAFFGWDA